MKYKPEEEKLLMTELWSPVIKDNPLNFVKFAFPWGMKDTPLEDFRTIFVSRIHVAMIWFDRHSKQHILQKINPEGEELDCWFVKCSQARARLTMILKSANKRMRTKDLLSEAESLGWMRTFNLFQLFFFQSGRYKRCPLFLDNIIAERFKVCDFVD